MQTALRAAGLVQAGGIGNLSAHLPEGEPRIVLAVVGWLAVTYVLFRWVRRL